ncbi:4685_t:CDS:2, partial [Funneliformis mosseae]
YHNHYFKEVDISCQYFLTLAILKLQRHEMNHSMHYQCHLSNLEYELKQQVTVESPRGMFSEDMFDTCVIELAQLIVDLDPTRICELWPIETGRIEELYKIHDKLIKEIEFKVTQIVQGNETTEFACTISNPISIRKKGRKPKNVSGDHKSKKRQVVECNQNKENSIYDNDHGELLHKRLQKALQDNLNTNM